MGYCWVVRKFLHPLSSIQRVIKPLHPSPFISLNTPSIQSSTGQASPQFPSEQFWVKAESWIYMQSWVLRLWNFRGSPYSMWNRLSKSLKMLLPKIFNVVWRHARYFHTKYPVTVHVGCLVNRKFAEVKIVLVVNTRLKVHCPKPTVQMSWANCQHAGVFLMSKVKYFFLVIKKQIFNNLAY